jgi:two-component system, OmpR family, sensor histidine kinase KdpD
VISVLVISLALVTWLGLHYFSAVGVTVISMLYLLSVLWAAYFMRLIHALGTAVAAFLLINFCFIEPRYSLSIASIHSWVTLMVFAIVAFVVSSAMQQLKQQMQRAQLAAQQSHFFQSLAELLGTQANANDLLVAACQHIYTCLALDVAVLSLSDDGLKVEARAGVDPALIKITPASLQWALDYNRAIGAGTRDWPELAYCIIPFGFPQREVLLIQAKDMLPELHFLQLLAHQCAQAHAKLTQQIALAQAERDATEANFKKTLLTALSHDMRTPLTAILGAVNVLSDKQITLASGQSDQLLQSIQAETTYLTQATENILTLVKLESGTSSLHLDWQSPQEIVQHVLQRYQQRSPTIVWVVNMPDQELLIKMDAVLVAHALANLLDNAMQWQFDNTPIEITLELKESWLSFSVTNQGAGFPEGFVVSAFSTRTQRATHSRGFGLGLSIVEMIVQLHQGKLEIASASNQSTCVSMLFQFVPPAMSEMIA